jgi:hypothetical protein
MAPGTSANGQRRVSVGNINVVHTLPPHWFADTEQILM